MASKSKNKLALTFKAAAWLLLGAFTAFIMIVLYAVFAGTVTQTLSDFSPEEEKSIAKYVGLSDMPESAEIKSAEYVRDIMGSAVLTLRFSAEADDADFFVSGSYPAEVEGNDSDGKILVKLTATNFVNPEFSEMVKTKCGSDTGAAEWSLAAVLLLTALVTVTMSARCLIAIFKK